MSIICLVCKQTKICRNVLNLAHQKSPTSYFLFIFILYRRDDFSILQISRIRTVINFNIGFKKVLKFCGIPGHAHSLQPSLHAPTKLSRSKEATRTWFCPDPERLSLVLKKIIRPLFKQTQHRIYTFFIRRF